MTVYKGKGICGGVAVGRVMVYHRGGVPVKRTRIRNLQVEIEKFEAAKAYALRQFSTVTVTLPSGSVLVPITATAPAFLASAANSCASTLVPLTQKNTLPLVTFRESEVISLTSTSSSA